MTPLDRFEASLAKLQSNGCKPDSTVQSTNQSYKSQTDETDRRLQEKHAQELRKLLG